MLTRTQLAIGTALREGAPKNTGSKLGYAMAITAVANALQQVDPQFDRERWIEAATVRAPRQDALGLDDVCEAAP